MMNYDKLFRYTMSIHSDKHLSFLFDIVFDPL